ncbi:hypothetical protein BN1723_015450 [Verticillium longisporum]|uniref:Major facilitator superfamily (MFS) profile domain-containing protein n=1 Tax=Verticillium longisporum TaxID=100787 RepID=A0A0G4MX55_VERLO|nr:hypothetical protein BN1723_015450 [Verticillium longisporum]
MKTKHAYALGALAALANVASADLRFRSRPELAIPRLNITTPAYGHATEKGLIFITPYEGFAEGHKGPTQPGAYIFRDDGELVWSGTGFHAGWVANFRPETWDGKQYLRAFQGTLDGLHGRMYGYHTLLGNDYEVAKVVRAGSHRLVSAHEFRVVDGKTALIETPIPRTISLKPWGGSDDQRWIVSGGFQEVDIETGDVLFEWESLDHVDPKLSAFPPDFGPGLPGSGRNETDAWNYFRINSVDKDDEGHYLLSARNITALFKINGTSGEIIWQLGGYRGGSDFEIAETEGFAFQHHARFRGLKIRPYSRARVVQLNHTSGVATSLRTYDAPDGLSARTQGSVQLLPNGNVFVKWGEAGAVTEFRDGGQVLFHAYLDSAPVSRFVQSYRGFRANWTAIPAEEPDIATFVSRESTLTFLDIFVSWNGDTETKTWQVYSCPSTGESAVLVGKAQRDGFETKIRLHGIHDLESPVLFAEAVDGNGKTLGKTRDVSVSGNPASAWDRQPAMIVHQPALPSGVVLSIDTAIMPLLTLGFYALQLDRGNIGNALTDFFLRDVGITQNQFNVGQQLLPLGIIILEMPSNLVLYRIGPVLWLGGQMMAWTFQKGLAAYFVTRFLLGLGEAGFIPGSLYTITRWYKRNETSKRFSIFFLGNMLASATSGLIAFGIHTVHKEYCCLGQRAHLDHCVRDKAAAAATSTGCVAKKPKPQIKSKAARPIRDLDRPVTSSFLDFAALNLQQCWLAYYILDNFHGAKVQENFAETDGFVVPMKYDKAIDALVVAALSQATSWANANRPWQERIEQGGIEQLQNALRPGGMQNRKSKLLTTLLRDVKARYVK